MMTRPALLACLLCSLGATAGAQTTGTGFSPVFATFATDVTVTANVALANQYRYRGIGQTNGRPALQGGFDLVHASGFYMGNWNSSISWLSDSNPDVSASLEMDFKGGYKTTTGPVAWDVGVLQYAYPGSRPDGFTSPDTTEVYASAGAGPVVFKYSHVLTNLFGFADTKGSDYADLTGTMDTDVWGVTAIAHVGRQWVHNLSAASYTDWRLGVSKDLGANTVVSAAWLDTNADRGVYTNTRGRYLGKGMVLVSLTRTF
jgi:uncharacterized protein (TIGR02001 family)